MAAPYERPAVLRRETLDALLADSAPPSDVTPDGVG